MLSNTLRSGIELLAQLIEVRDLEPGAEADRARSRARARRAAGGAASSCPEPFGPMRPTRSPRVIVVREVAHDRRDRRARSSRRAPRRRAAPSARPPAPGASRCRCARVARRARRAAPRARERVLRCACAAPGCRCESRPPPSPASCRTPPTRAPRRRAPLPCARDTCRSRRPSRRAVPRSSSTMRVATPAQKRAIVRDEERASCRDRSGSSPSTRSRRRRDGSWARRGAARRAARTSARASSVWRFRPPDAAANGASASSPRCESTVSTRVCSCHASAASSA